MELYALARHNVVSTRDATTLGLGPADLRRMVKRGEIRRLIRGWYAVGAPDADRPPWEGEDDWETARAAHRLLTIALLRSFEGRVVASHQSALVLHGVRLWKSDLETAHVCRNDDDHSRRRKAAVLHPECGADPVETAEGFRTVPVAMAVVQVGLQAPRDGLPPFPFESLVAADAALHDGVVTKEELEAAVKAHSRHPGIHRVRSLLAHADGRHESVGETRLAHTMRVLGYQFTPQVKVTAGGRRWRVDFVLDDDPVIVEFDGLAKYSGGLVNPSPEHLRQALALEKWREDRLRGTGREVARFVWAEADDAHAVRSRLDAAIARARRRLGA
jgi:very-short-patch-repair endonuclease